MLPYDATLCLEINKSVRKILQEACQKGKKNLFGVILLCRRITIMASLDEFDSLLAINEPDAVPITVASLPRLH